MTTSQSTSKLTPEEEETLRKESPDGITPRLTGPASEMPQMICFQDWITPPPLKNSYQISQRPYSKLLIAPFQKETERSTTSYGVMNYRRL